MSWFKNAVASVQEFLDVVSQTNLEVAEYRRSRTENKPAEPSRKPDCDKPIDSLSETARKQALQAGCEAGAVHKGTAHSPQAGAGRGQQAEPESRGR